jgi:hypothetical protein
MNEGQNTFQQIIEDLHYLIDELDALKYVVNSVPVYERPGQSLSICEIIRLIDFAQESYYKPIMEKHQFSAGRIPFPTLLEIEKGFLENRSDITYEQDKGINHYIGKLSKHRVNFLISIKKDYQSHVFYHFFESIVTLERELLKQIAERVLSIKSKD